MGERLVPMYHPVFGESKVMPSSFKVWERKGWSLNPMSDSPVMVESVVEVSEPSEEDDQWDA